MTTDGTDDVSVDGTVTSSSGHGGDAVPTATADRTDTAASQPLIDENLRTFPWLRAGAVGLAAFLVEYAVVAATFLFGPASISGASLAEQAKVYGFVLYNAHHVTIVTQAEGIEMAGSPVVNILYGQTNTAVPVELYFLVPILGLLVAGAVLAYSRDGERVASLREEFALVVTGLSASYLLVALVGRFAFVRRMPIEGADTAAVAAPSIYLTLVLMTLFPVLFGGVGTAAVLAWQERVRS